MKRLLLAACAMAAMAAPAGAQDRAPVRLNQLGLQTDGPKMATVATPATEPLAWRVLGADGSVAAQGRSRVVGQDATAGEHLHTVDFSALATPGDYRLEVGELQSRPFAVGDNPWAGLTRQAMSFFYQQRAGVPILAAHVERPDLARAAGHREERLTCFAGQDAGGHDWPGCDYRLDVTGGWYDAGDHGKYVVNGGISLWTLLNLHERGGPPAALVADGRLALPEAGDGVADILDEARFQLEFMLAMQVPEGARLRLPVGARSPGAAPVFTEIDASGLVHHKAHDLAWTGLPMAPADDPQPRFLYPPTTAATLNLAAVAAQGARLWRDVDPAFADRYLEAARRAFAAARRHPDIHAWDFHGGGSYGDGDLTDEVYWAAAELHVTTGEAEYAQAARDAGATPAAMGDIAWASVGLLGAVSLATAQQADAQLKQQARDALMARADAYADEASRTGYGHPFAGDRYAWGSNGDLLNRALVLGVAHGLEGRQAHRDAMVAAMDYVLGRNPLDQSYVTGVGARPMRNPHHRFWAHAADPAYPKPPSGVLSGGPNNTSMTDPVALELRGRCAPQTCWADHIDSYALNEVTINWNAPLVWVAAQLEGR